jgi:hypothetical protein
LTDSSKPDRRIGLSADGFGTPRRVELSAKKPARDEEADMAGNAPRELAYRESPGLEVTLLWHPDDDTLTVSVVDTTNGESFVLDADPHDVLDVFDHPYAHAPLRAASSAPACRPLAA